MRKIILAGVFLVLAAGGWWWFTASPVPPLPGPPHSASISSTAPAASADARGLPTLAPMLRRAMPAVVSITVLARVPAEDNPLLKDPYYRRFFGNEPPAQKQSLSAGSGVVIDADRGLVLTNAHVVRNAERIGLALTDGRHIEATLVGADPATDIALLKVAVKGLVALPLGNSDALEIGDYLVAIGNPFGLGQTVTTGIVSALGRSGLGIEGFEDFIQTDAAINPGNSGGALVDIEGRLVGINTAIIGPAGGSVGIGFAIPANMARQIADQLDRFGKVVRGVLGISVEDHPSAMSTTQKTATPPGAIVAKVAQGSAAEKADIRNGDLIIAVNNRPVAGVAQLRTRIGLVRVGETIELELLRNGSRVKVSARIVEAVP